MLTKEQWCVIETKVNKYGYEFWGKTKSLLNGLDCYIVSKGRDTLVVNTLGYNEKREGVTFFCKDLDENDPVKIEDGKLVLNGEVGWN